MKVARTMRDALERSHGSHVSAIQETVDARLEFMPGGGVIYWISVLFMDGSGGAVVAQKQVGSGNAAFASQVNQPVICYLVINRQYIFG